MECCPWFSLVFLLDVHFNLYVNGLFHRVILDGNGCPSPREAAAGDFTGTRQGVSMAGMGI